MSFSLTPNPQSNSKSYCFYLASASLHFHCPHTSSSHCFRWDRWLQNLAQCFSMMALKASGITCSWEGPFYTLWDVQQPWPQLSKCQSNSYHSHSWKPYPTFPNIPRRNKSTCGKLVILLLVLPLPIHLQSHFSFYSINQITTFPWIKTFNGFLIHFK